MVIEEDACIARVDAWIKKIKENVYKQNININSENSDDPENPEELFAYKSKLEDLEDNLSRAIKDQNTEALSLLGWPNELMDCITDMTLRTDILDHLHQAFKVHHFNKSPKHENELRKATLW
jgi:hypothetical protein